MPGRLTYPANRSDGSVAGQPLPFTNSGFGMFTSSAPALEIR